MNRQDRMASQTRSLNPRREITSGAAPASASCGPRPARDGSREAAFELCDRFPDVELVRTAAVILDVVVSRQAYLPQAIGRSSRQTATRRHTDSLSRRRSTAAISARGHLDPLETYGLLPLHLNTVTPDREWGNR